MHTENRTVIGIFSDITEARRATDELHGKGISAARLVEHDLDVTFTGTAEREGASRADSAAGGHHKSGGVKGFFARLFGLDGDRPSWKLNSDSASFFEDAYHKKHNLIIIEDCPNVELCRDIISRMGGVVEEKGSHYYHTERNSQRERTSTMTAAAAAGSSDASMDKPGIHAADRALARDESLDSGMRSAVDYAADSGLGVDVDRMPFAHPTTHNTPNVSDRISQSSASGTADHIPFSGTLSDTEAPSQDGTGSIDRSSLAGRPTTIIDPAMGKGLSVPSEVGSFAGEGADESLIVSGDRSGAAERRPLASQASAHPTGAAGGTTGDRYVDSIIVGDDRVHDRGVSNADVARISSDRIMEVGPDDQHLVDEDTDTLGSDQSLDNGHILPDKSFPPPRGHESVHPAP